MDSDPVIHGRTPPCYRLSGLGTMSKRQGPSHLMGIHPSCSTIEPFNCRGVGGVVSQLIQGLIDARPTAMGFSDFNGLELSPLAMLDHLDMGEGSGNSISGAQRTTHIIQAGGR